MQVARTVRGATRRGGRATTLARALAAAGVAALAVLLWGGYVRHWVWTGFGDNDTLWDWLKLVLLPTAVATLPLWLRHRPLIHARGRLAVAAAVTAFAALVVAGYVVPLPWTGFRGNTLWDWLELLVLPVVLVFLGPWTDVAARLRDHPRRHALALGAAGFVALAIAGYTIPMLWTGFPGNTLWDWLQLWLLPLLVPTILGPALLRWIAVEEEKPAGAGPSPPPPGPRVRVPARRAAVASAAAVGLVALSAGVAVGSAALGHDSGARPAVRGACAVPGARTVAADGANRVVRAGTSLFACRPGAHALRIAPATGAGRPTAIRLAAGRIVYARQACAARGCAVAVRVLRLSDGRGFVRARFARSGPVAGLTVSPRGALALMLGPRCPACGGARLVLIDARGTRVADAGAQLDPTTLAEAGTTVFWRHGARAESARLSG
jgi:hypothetical protein